MTDETAFTVRDLLPSRLDRLDEVLQNELGKEEGVGALAWDVVESQATDAIASALDCDPFEVLARGWAVARNLHEYADASKHPRRERSVVHLGKHPMTVTMHPVLKYRIGPVASPPLRFTLELTAEFESVALSIKDGHITGIGSGECYVSAQLKYRDVKLHPEQQSRHVKLPGYLKFNVPGVPIR